ncbi:MAG TPA: SPOR domain-containing protein [Burkholderiaceae bacterium]
MSAGKNERGGFVLGLIVGLLVGLAIALGVALYINKTPIPFMNKVPQRTAEQDQAEAQRNKDWDPNAPLAGKVASGVVGGTPAAKTDTAASAAAAAPSAPVASAPAKAEAKAKSDSKPEAKADAKLDPKADGFIYFVQAGAYLKPDDAETQRAKLAIQGFTTKVFEYEQSGRAVYRVRLGPIDLKDDAEAQQKKLEAAGVEANLVRIKR